MSQGQAYMYFKLDQKFFFPFTKLLKNNYKLRSSLFLPDLCTFFFSKIACQYCQQIKQLKKIRNQEKDSNK